MPMLFTAIWLKNFVRENNYIQHNIAKEVEIMKINDDLSCIYPPDGSTFDTHTPIQSGFIERINCNGIDCALEWLSTVKCDRECSYPAVLTFKWEEDTSKEYCFEISKTPDFEKSNVIKCSKPTCDITNLETGRKYFWRVNGGKTHSFCTKENLIRFIKIDGALNVRDLGGNKIRQGLIYRGSDLDSHYKITEKGISFKIPACSVVCFKVK